MSLEFLIAALIVVLVPGTGVVYMIANGLTANRRENIAAAAGCTLGILPSITASLVGMAAILHTSAVLFQVLKFAGVAYLLYLAWKSLGESGPLRISAQDRPETRSLVAIARTGILINTLNPKLSAFFLAFLPQFVDPASGSATAQMVLMSAVFMAMTFVVFVIYGAFAAVVGERILRSARVMTWMRRAIAATFAGFGIRLAFTGP